MSHKWHTSHELSKDEKKLMNYKFIVEDIGRLFFICIVELKNNYALWNCLAMSNNSNKLIFSWVGSSAQES